jgi:hypothetical protein
VKKKEGSGLAQENAWTSRPDAKKKIERAQQHMTAEVQSCSNKHKKTVQSFGSARFIFLEFLQALFCKLLDSYR